MPTGKTILGEKTVMLHFQQIELITVDTNDQEIKNLLEHAKEVFLGKPFYGIIQGTLKMDIEK